MSPYDYIGRNAEGQICGVKLYWKENAQQEPINLQEFLKKYPKIS